MTRRNSSGGNPLGITKGGEFRARKRDNTEQLTTAHSINEQKQLLFTTPDNPPFSFPLKPLLPPFLSLYPFLLQSVTNFIYITRRDNKGRAKGKGIKGKTSVQKGGVCGVVNKSCCICSELLDAAVSCLVVLHVVVCCCRVLRGVVWCSPMLHPLLDNLTRPPYNTRMPGTIAPPLTISPGHNQVPWANGAKL